jgi:hypothetical protein
VDKRSRVTPFAAHAAGVVGHESLCFVEPGEAGLGVHNPPRREAAEVRSGVIGELVDDGLEVSQVEPYRFAVAAEHRPEGIGSCVAGHESVISKTRLSGADV